MPTIEKVRKFNFSDLYFLQNLKKIEKEGNKTIIAFI